MVLERSEVPPENFWKVESLYESIEKWREDLEGFSEKKGDFYFPDIQRHRGNLHLGSKEVAETLNLYFEVERFLSKLHTYAHLRHDEDLEKEGPKKANDTISSLYHRFSQETAWIEPELLHLPENSFQKLLEEKDLQLYKTYLTRLHRMRFHTLGEKEEELLAMSAKSLQGFHKVFSNLSGIDMVFEPAEDSAGNKQELTEGTYSIYLKSGDRKLRQESYQNLHAGYESFQNTFCEILKGEVESQVFCAKARRFEDCLQAAIKPKNIDRSVYESLIQGVQARLDLLHRYTKLRKKILKVENLYPYDLYVPLVGEVEEKWDYKQAVDLVLDSLSPLGDKYRAILEKGLKEEGWVDIYENKRKRSGAYSSGCYDSHPYILLNYHGFFSDVTTLTHEAGHSMHSYKSRTCQPYLYADYPIFLAEVASTFHEQLLLTHLLKKEKNLRKRAYLLNFALEQIRTTLYRQTLFAEFELMLHKWVEEGIPVTPQLLRREYLGLYQKYYGETLTLSEQEPVAVEWARVPHFYYNYYVYQYATGISAALAFSQKEQQGNFDREVYLQFLSSGCSKDPIETLQEAGVDLTSPKVVEEALCYFGKLLEEFEKCIENTSMENTDMALEE